MEKLRILIEEQKKLNMDDSNVHESFKNMVILIEELTIYLENILNEIKPTNS
jgi:hypothetical protein